MFVMKKGLLLFLLIFTFLNCISLKSQVWEPQATGVLPSNYNVSDISIVSDEVIWAVAIDYSQANSPVPETHIIKLLRTVDGGITWDTTDIEEAMGRVSWDIHAFGDSIACITTQNLQSASGRGVFRTTDGGENWTEVLPGNAGGVWLHFFDEQEGICINSSNMARTMDGGMSWEYIHGDSIPDFQNGEFNLFQFSSTAFATFEDFLWFGTNKGRVYRTEDRGQSWEVFDTGLGDSGFRSIAFTDDLNGLAIFKASSTISHLLKTTNGGMSWVNLGDTDFDEVSAIPCSEVFMGTTVPLQRLTSISISHGESWTVLDDSTYVSAPVFLSPKLGWAAKRLLNPGSLLHKWSYDELEDCPLINDTKDLLTKAEKVQVFPNPFSNHVNIRTDELGIEEVRVLDSSARLLNTFTTQNRPSSATLELSHLSAGLYFLEIRTSEGFITKKIVK